MLLVRRSLIPLVLTALFAAALPRGGSAAQDSDQLEQVGFSGALVGTAGQAQPAKPTLNLGAAPNSQHGFGAGEGTFIPTSGGGLRLSVGSSAPASPQPRTTTLPARVPTGPPVIDSGGEDSPIKSPWVLAAAGALILLAMLGFSKGQSSSEDAPRSFMPPANSWQSSYPIVRVIGQGGMGVVYEATDRSLDRRVAIKRMRDEIREDFALRERFLREAKMVAGLHHPAIVDIYAIVEQAGELFLVFEFVEGRTVEAVLKERGRFTAPETRSILDPVCRALDFAHGRNIIHRDLKPSNVMITDQGYVKVMDFGIARQVKDSVGKGAPQPHGGDAGVLAMTNTVTGTPLYMAPEAESGEVRAESDIYSLGCMAYEMLTGQVPFPPPASSLQKLTRSYTPLREAVPDAPPYVASAIDAALEPDPSQRLKTAAEFLQRMSPS